MKKATLVTTLLVAVFLVTPLVVTRGSEDNSTLTYQGRLTQDGAAPNGIYDVRFALFADEAGGLALGSACTNLEVNVNQGVFTARIDFGPGVFGSEPRWLEIAVRTNGASDYTRLVPRQLMTPVPEAFYAQEAGVSLTASNIAWEGITGLPENLTNLAAYAAGVGLSLSNDVFALDTQFTDGRYLRAGEGPLSAVGGINVGTNSGFTVDEAGNAVVGKAVTINAAHYPQPGVGGVFWTPDGGAVNSDESNPVGKIQVFEDWGGQEDGRTLLIGSRNIRIENGWYKPGGYISIGNEDLIMGEIKINYTPLRLNAEGTGMAYYDQPGQPFAIGVGLPLVFTARSCDETGLNYASSPGIQSRGVAQSSPPALYGPPDDQRALGELWFYSGTPVSLGEPNYYDAYPGVVVGRALTNGWDFRGKIIQERVMAIASGPAFTLDFNTAYCLDITLTGDVAFSSGNWVGGATNMETRIVYLHGGGADRVVSFPSEWRVASETGTASLPTALGRFRGMRIRLENLGGGEGNMVARFETFHESAPADADVSAFLSRSGLSATPAQRDALNQFVSDLKRAGLWEKFDCIYPFLGGAAAAGANLKSSEYTIRWSVPLPVFDQRGVTGTGSSYGDTGYVPSDGSRWSRDSASMAVYVGTATPASGQFIGVSFGGSRANFGKNAEGGLYTGGLNNNNVPTYEWCENWRGLLVASRTSEYLQEFSIRAEPPVQNRQPADGVPTGPVYVLARNVDGVALDLSDANLQLVMLGSGLDTQEVVMLNGIADGFLSLLGR